MSNGELLIELKPYERATLSDIPAGVAYQVYEETEEGWLLAYSSNTSGVIDPVITKQSTFMNRRYVGQATVTLVGSKTLDGQAANADAFEFELLSGDTSIQKVLNTSGGAIMFEPLTFTYNQVGQTFTYTIREIAGGDSSITYDTHEEPLS